MFLCPHISVSLYVHVSVSKRSVCLHLRVCLSVSVCVVCVSLSVCLPFAPLKCDNRLKLFDDTQLGHPR